MWLTDTKIKRFFDLLHSAGQLVNFFTTFPPLLYRPDINCQLSTVFSALVVAARPPRLPRTLFTIYTLLVHKHIHSRLCCNGWRAHPSNTVRG